MRYTPTSHAIERARIRFGVRTEKVKEWINEVMKGAKYVAAQGKNRLLYKSSDGNIRIIVDANTRTVVTVHHALRMDFLRPAHEREIRQIKREGTRQIRAAERNLAEAYAELAEKMKNFANARNPKTRELIESRIEEAQADINDYKLHIEQMQDAMQEKIREIELIAE